MRLGDASYDVALPPTGRRAVRFGLELWYLKDLGKGSR